MIITGIAIDESEWYKYQDKSHNLSIWKCENEDSKYYFIGLEMEPNESFSKLIKEYKKINLKGDILIYDTKNLSVVKIR
jgi:hypothetical protein